jgi:hypothetical protein
MWRIVCRITRNTPASFIIQYHKAVSTSTGKKLDFRVTTMKKGIQGREA